MNELEMKRFTKQFLYELKNCIDGLSNGKTPDLLKAKKENERFPRSVRSLIFSVTEKIIGCGEFKLEGNYFKDKSFSESEIELTENMNKVIGYSRKFWCEIDSGSMFFEAESIHEDNDIEGYDEYILLKLKRRHEESVFGTPYREEKDSDFFSRLHKHRLDGAFRGHLKAMDLGKFVKKCLSERYYLPSLKEILLEAFIRSYPTLPDMHPDCSIFEFDFVLNHSMNWIHDNSDLALVNLKREHVHDDFLEKYLDKARKELDAICISIESGYIEFVVETNYRDEGILFTLVENTTMQFMISSYKQ